MNKYKLTYFNFRGRGEVARYLFALADIDYTDERIPHYRDEEWSKMKPNYMWGMLPQLDVDGWMVCQSRTINRFLARQFGLMGKDEFESARIDMLIDCVDDIVEPVVEFFFNEKDPQRKEYLKGQHEKMYPTFLENMNKFLCENRGGDGWFVGNSVTLADVYVYNNMAWILLPYPEALDDYPKMKDHRKRFEKLPKISGWMTRRPHSDM